MSTKINIISFSYGFNSLQTNNCKIKSIIVYFLQILERSWKTFEKIFPRYQYIHIINNTMCYLSPLKSSRIILHAERINTTPKTLDKQHIYNHLHIVIGNGTPSDHRKTKLISKNVGKKKKSRSDLSADDNVTSSHVTL